jgi:hypothetical protein
MAPIERRTRQKVENDAGGYVVEEPIDSALMASATTGDVLTVKADDTVVPRTLTAGSNITITIGDTTITFDATGGSGGGGGSLVLLDEKVASGSATLDFTTGINSTYDAYFLQVGDMVPATDGADLMLRFSTDGGSSFIATNYNYALRNFFADAFDGEANSTSATHIPIGTSLGNATGEHWNANVWLNNLQGALYKSVRFDGFGYISNPLAGVAHGMGIYGTASDVDALRLLMSSGNITSGWARLYGVAKTPSGSGAIVLYDSGALASPASTLDTGVGGIAGGYNVLEIWIIARTDQAVAQSSTNLTFNGDTAGNYDRQFDRGADTTASAGGTSGGNALGMLTAGTSTDSGVFSIYRISVPFYAETTAHKVCEITDGSADSLAADRRANVQVGRWRSTAAITRVTFTAPGGQNFAAGSHMICYGR